MTQEAQQVVTPLAALKLALEALDNLMYWDNGKSEYDEARDAIIAIKQALAQHDSVQAKPEPEHEPVAFKCGDAIVHIKPPVYGATPPQRTWVGLTDKERETATGWSVEHIEDFLKQKNGYAEEKNNPLQPEEHNFCPRCGKRNKDIHTCTPPQD